MYTDTESLCYTPGTNGMFCVNYTSIQINSYILTCFKREKIEFSCFSKQCRQIVTLEIYFLVRTFRVYVVRHVIWHSYSVHFIFYTSPGSQFFVEKIF